MPQSSMVTVASLLRRARFGLRLLAGPAAEVPIRHVAGVETLADIEGAPPGSLIVIIGSAPEPISGYEIDVAIRQAAARGFAGMVFGAPRQLPVTAARLAHRADLPVLGSGEERGGADLLLELDRFVRGGASEALARAKSAIYAAQQAAEEDARDPVGAVLDAAAESLGCLVILEEAMAVDHDEPGAVVVGQHVVGRVVPQVDDDATRVALPTIAGLVSRLRQSELNRRFAPALSRAELIVQILLSERTQLPQLVEQAFQIDLPIERTHVVAWLHIDDDLDRADMSLARARQLLGEAELTTLQVLHARPGTWHVASLGGDLIVVRTGPARADLHRQARVEMEHLVTLLAVRGDITITGGLGTPQVGPDGLRQSAAEARVAADSARAGGREGKIVDSDASGLRRVLADLYSSPLSRNLLHEMLAPLDALGPARARVGITTLSAYLHALGSPTRAAAELHLHPNAVSYRLGWIAEALDVDLKEPDTRFALDLACRVRLLNA